MGIKVDPVKDSKYRMGREMPKKINPKRGRKLAHDPDSGFPHYSSITHECMCLDTCCQGESGCICKSCPCRGAGHVSGM